jgi:integrase
MAQIPYKKSKKPRVVPKRLKNADVRSREYLTEEEVEKLIIAASKHEKNGLRDSLMIRMAFRHGLRAGEVVDLQWDQLDLKKGTILVKRLKNGEQSTQALNREELHGLRKLPKDSNFVFLGQRGPLFVDSFQLLVKKAGQAAKLGFPVHPHMLRHARGFDLANKGADTRVLQQLLGHKNIRHTVTHTKLTDKRVLELSKL